MNKSTMKKGGKSVWRGAKKGISGAKNVAQGVDNKDLPKVVKGVKLIGQAIKDTAKGTKDIAVGIFNDPNWWKGRTTPYLAVNPSRPMDPSDLDALSEMGTRLGVGHLSSLEVNFNDIFSSPVLLSATSQMFQTIRNNLRSNLQYSLEDLQNYLKLVTNIMIEVKMVERTLGWHNYARSDIPEFHEAWVVYPIPTDIGRVNYTFRSNTGDAYPEAISRVDILKSSVRQLAIPRKLGEFISWLYGSVFTDPDTYNPQVYYVDATKVSLYLDPEDDTLTTFDPRDQSIQQIINQCAAILSKYGALIADLGRISTIYPDAIGLVDFITPSEYKSTMLYDQEFINFLINGYTLNATDGMKKSDFFRIDILENVLDDPGHTAAITNGMGAILSSQQFKAISVVAQDYYIMAGTTNMPRNVSQTTSNQVFGSINAYTAADGLWIIRTTTSVMNKFSMSLTNASSSVTVDLSHKVTWATPSSGTLLLQDLITNNFEGAGPFAGRPSILNVKAKVLEGNVSTGFMDAYFESRLTVNYDKSYSFDNPQVVFYVNGTKSHAMPITTTPVLTILNTGWSAWQDWTFQVTITGNFPISNKAVISMFELSSTILPTASPAYMVRFTYSNADALYSVEFTSLASTCAWLTQMYDYHIPYVVRDSIHGGSSAPLTINLTGPVYLLKECYISVVYNVQELEAVVQQLYYNLIAIE